MKKRKGNLFGKVLGVVIGITMLLGAVEMLMTGTGRKFGLGGIEIIFEKEPIYFSVIVLVSLALGVFVLYSTFFYVGDDYSNRDDD